MSKTKQKSQTKSRVNKAGDWKAIADKAGDRVRELFTEHATEIGEIAKDPESGGANLTFGIVLDTEGPNWEMRTTLSFAKKFRFSKDDKFEDGRQSNLPLPSDGDPLPQAD